MVRLCARSTVRGIPGSSCGAACAGCARVGDVPDRKAGEVAGGEGKLAIQDCKRHSKWTEAARENSRPSELDASSVASRPLRHDAALHPRETPQGLGTHKADTRIYAPPQGDFQGSNPRITLARPPRHSYRVVETRCRQTEAGILTPKHSCRS